MASDGCCQGRDYQTLKHFYVVLILIDRVPVLLQLIFFTFKKKNKMWDPSYAPGLFGATHAAPPYATGPPGLWDEHAPVAPNIESGGHMFSLGTNAVTASHDISMVRLLRRTHARTHARARAMCAWVCIAL